VDWFRRMNKNEYFNENLLMMKLTVRILLICLILAVSVYGPDATATYGAEQFELQLTAIANPGP
jgi:hypothetical protein